jgi:NAD(P)-binding Rossmann-like domain
MRLTRRQALKTLAGSGAAVTAASLGGLTSAKAAASSGADIAGSADSEVIERDVCVIGGGSAGTYTAVRLSDLGQSVVVVERQDRLGGHCQTYTDPVTGLTTDIGVIIFPDLPIVRGYFGRFGIPLATAALGGGPASYADFRTGEVVSGYTPPVPTALETFVGILQQYPYLAPGYYLPDPVPGALLQPWGDFVAANGLSSMVQLSAAYGQGLNEILRLPTLYILRLLGLTVVENILADSFLTTPDNDNSALYQAATAFLGRDVLLSTTVVASQRGGNGVWLFAVGPRGPVTIRARKIVITIPPLPSALAAFDLDARELGLFSRFRQGNYYTGLVRLPGVPDETNVMNIGANTPYNLAPLPSLYGVGPSSVPGLFNVKFASHVPLSDSQVRASIRESLGRLQAAGTIPATRPTFADFASHTPYELTVSAPDIAAGFYSSLYGLQGLRSTYWNGAAFEAHNSALIWQFTETLLPAITG